MSGGRVAEKNSDCRLAGRAAMIRRMSWMKPMSSMRSASSSTKISTRRRRTLPLAAQVQQAARRGHQDVHPAGERGDLGALAHAAEDDRLAQRRWRP